MDRTNYNRATGGSGRGRGRGRGGQYDHAAPAGGRGRGGSWGPTHGATNVTPARPVGGPPREYQAWGPPRPNPQFGARGGPVGGARAWVSPDPPRRPPETLPGLQYGRMVPVIPWPLSKRSCCHDCVYFVGPNELAFMSDLAISDISSVKISDESKILPIKRPDRGGTLAVRSSRLLVNHFPVSFDPETTIMHYDVDIKPVISSTSRFVKKSIPKGDLRLIREKLFSDSSNKFSMQMTAYDGEKNIFSAETLPTGKFDVELSDGEGTKSRSYTFTMKFVNELKLSKLRDYLSGNLIQIPRDILQSMDLVLKEHPSRHRISVGRSFYSTEYRRQDDLRCGVAAFRGFQQSIKPTSQGLVLCLDYSVLAFRKRLPVIDFLKEHVRGFNGVNDVRRFRTQVTGVLSGLKVTVTHRVTKQKYTVAGLTDRNTQDLSFILEDIDGKKPPTEVGLVNYFREKYGQEILYKDIPCLDLGKNKRKNYVPMEFCILAEGQRYDKEQLDRDAGLLLKKISLAPPRERKNAICEMLKAEDGPCGVLIHDPFAYSGDVIQSFGIGVNENMTQIVSRVIAPPDLKLGTPAGKMNVVRVDKDKCQWNLVGKSVVEGRPIDRWALIDFSSFDRYNKLNPENFIWNLRGRLKNLGVRIEEPLVCRFTNMHEFSDVNRLRQLLEGVIKEASRKSQDRLQIIVCVMAAKHYGYKFLKWVSETQIGVVTQCCLSSNANKANDQYLANLGLKLNAKLGGSNAELMERLPRFEGEDHVMFIGADVNHPASHNTTCPSIAAVVATVNWPAANRYAARVCPQDHRKEKILSFGTMCLDLINTYARFNKVKPKKIVVFRDGVSEGQFDMVLNEELLDLKNAIYEEHYRPRITLVVAQKRHQTRLFPENERDGGSSGNVPPGTVVDTIIVHPFEFDFYLCSHYGGLGTSKPTHYYVLYDDHGFTSDQLQKLIYNLCFTFARCTKPVSLAPPVYYADLVAYRGRMFQEVVMELQSPASASSASSSSVTSSYSSAASFDDRFYKLHPELQNIMFFV
ncbi:hypothetical protein RJ639_011392 [Escallonia herrerae]|uniref:Argonaute 2 n=1 Tax=Escallonia herrerae TaxID=1293975 RepID=A0AA88VMA0_9ASTE|nr:hypothetical protein RJ639_011392 [Escallonia herrerae]